MANKNPQLIPSYEMSEVFGLKMVILMESEPQSDHYHQLVLNKDQFKTVSDVIADTIGKKMCEQHDMEEVNMILGPDCIFVHDVDSFYSQEYINDNIDENTDDTEDIETNE